MIEVCKFVELSFGKDMVVEEGRGKGRVREAGGDGEDGVEAGGEVCDVSAEGEVGLGLGDIRHFGLIFLDF